MGKFHAIFVVSFFACSQPILVSEAVAQTNLANEEYICAGESIDSDFVVTERIVDKELEGLCPAGEALKVVDVGALSSIDVCNGSPIPAGWVVTSINTSSGLCAGAWRLRITNTVGLSSITACNGTPIPNGWVVTSVYPSNGVCAYLSFLSLVNSAPPPPPPPPLVPAAPTMLPIVKTGSTHIVSWIAPNDYPEYRHRFALERKVNDGGWSQIWKGWDNTSWTSGSMSAGTYSYRVKRITPVMSGQYSGAVTVVHGGLGD